jgi:hypothetical protein
MAAEQDHTQIDMRFVSTITFVGALVLLSACKTDDVRQDVPAQIIDPTPASRAELQHVVSNALGGRAVTIADDALTKDSLLIIEPKHLTGRDLGRPDHFRLVLSDSRCVLVHEESNARIGLMETSCAAE